MWSALAAAISLTIMNAVVRNQNGGKRYNIMARVLRRCLLLLDNSAPLLLRLLLWLFLQRDYYRNKDLSSISTARKALLQGPDHQVQIGTNSFCLYTVSVHGCSSKPWPSMFWFYHPQVFVANVSLLKLS